MLDPTTILPESRRWQCQRCGNCCKWPGDVCVSNAEVRELAAFVGMDEDKFLEKYVRLRTDRKGLSLIEKDNHECIFLDGNSCVINEVKPNQCRGFPNQWNFLGWRDHCEAVAMDKESKEKVPHPTDKS